MTPDERQMLSGLFDRVRSASTGPRDPEAESFINDAMRGAPSAGYVLAQTVLVQQQALEAAARHITDLEAQAKAGPQEGGGFLGNIGRSLFGGAQTPAPPAPRGYDPGPGYQAQRPSYAPPPPTYAAPPPQYAPQPQQGGPWGASAPQSGGFLQGALQTATGVAGGVLVGNAIGGLFGGHGGGGLFGGGGGGGFGAPTEEVHETVNNYYGDSGSQDSGVDPGGADYSSGNDDSSGGGGGDDYA